MRAWKNLLILLLGIGISNVGAWIYLIALNLSVLEQTAGSAAAVAGLYIAGPAAVLITCFWSGSLIDRVNKRKILIALDLFRAVLICLLPFTDSLPAIYLIVFILGVASAVFEPASMAYVAMLLLPEQRKRFNALRGLATSGAFLVGPAVAGLLLAIGTPAFAILVNAGALAFSAVLAMLLPDVESGKTSESFGILDFDTIKSDWIAVRRFCRNNYHAAAVYLVFVGFMMMATALDSLEVSFAVRVLGLSNTQYGVLVSIAGAGIVSGAVLTAVWANRFSVVFLLGAGTFGTAIGYLIYAFSGTYAVAATGFFILAFALGFANTGFQTFCQEQIPAAMLGRFVSIFALAEALGIIAVTGLLGAFAHFFSLQGTVIGGSICMLGISAAMVIFSLEKKAAAIES